MSLGVIRQHEDKTVADPFVSCSPPPWPVAALLAHSASPVRSGALAVGFPLLAGMSKLRKSRSDCSNIFGLLLSTKLTCSHLLLPRQSVARLFLTPKSVRL